MRKGQIEILEILKSKQLPESYITYCSREDLLLWQLRVVLNYYYSKVHSLNCMFQNEDIIAIQTAFSFVDNYYDELLDAYYGDKTYSPSKSRLSNFVINMCINSEIAIKIFDMNLDPINTFLLLNFNRQFIEYIDYDFCKVFKMYKKISVLSEIKAVIDIASYHIYPSLCEAEKWIMQYIKDASAFTIDTIRNCYIHKLTFDEIKTVNFDYKRYIKEKIYNKFPILKENPYYCNEKLYFYNPKLVDYIKKSALTYGIEYDVILNFPVEQCFIEYNSTALNIKFVKYEKTNIFTVQNEIKEIELRVSGYKVSKSNEIIIFLDNMTSYVRHPRLSKLYPLPVKTCIFMYHTYALFKEFIKCFFDDKYREGYYVAKDIYNYVSDSKTNWIVVPSISVNDCIGKHSLDELMHSKYKTSDFINWNKGNIYINWLLFKSINMVDEKSKNILIECARELSHPDKINDFYNKTESYHSYLYNKDEIKYELLIYCIDRRCSEDTYWNVEVDEKNVVKADYMDVVRIIIDYIKISRELKRKIKLSFRSARKMKDAHDEVSVIYQAKKTPLIMIPKNTKFNQLRKLLPEEFEWIRSRKRIVYEGISMRHCVASYANKINNDKCAIYSFVYKEWNKRYTIEFCMKKNGVYYIQQIQSACDRGCSDEVKKYVESFIS